MTTYNIWRYTCETEGKVVREILNSTASPPTTCQHDRVGHTIDLTSVTKEKELSEKIVKVQEEHTPTGGKWEGTAFFLQGNTGPSETTQDFIWDNPISVLDIQIITEASNRYDAVQLEVIPPNIGFGEGVIGTLVQTGTTGATGISVSQSIIDNIQIADNLSLQQGAQVQELGNIISIDSVNNIVYCKNPLEYEFSAAGPTLVKFKRFVIENFVLGPPQRCPLGDSKIGGSYVPAGYIVRARYINNGTDPKELYCIIEYME